MLPVDAKNISNLFDVLAELEGFVSELYKTAGDLWEEDRDFWSALAQAEWSHAGYIRKMADILNMRPQEFEIGRSLTIAGIRTAISGVQNNIQRLKNGEMNKKQFLFISRDIEQSLLESRYTEILKTKDSEYQRLIYEVVSQTEVHKKLLVKKIEEAK